MIDPLQRWRAYGEKPDFAGLLTFGGLPYSEDPADLAGVDVAIVGAPTDLLVSDRPGARLGPRAIRIASCPPGPGLHHGIDATGILRVIDYGDAAVVPGDAAATGAAIEQIIAEIAAHGALPLMLGGDHSVTEHAVRALAREHGPVGLVHFDAHADTGELVFGSRASHGTQMRHLVEDGAVDPSRYVQVGLRGYWPGPDEFAWQAARGISTLYMHDVRERGIAAVIADCWRVVGEGPVYVTLDVDVLDPSVAPGTGTPEPGGMLAHELLEAACSLGGLPGLVGADVVEVLPLAPLTVTDPTALVADRLVRELLAGRARGRNPAPQANK